MTTNKTNPVEKNFSFRLFSPAAKQLTAKNGRKNGGFWFFCRTISLMIKKKRKNQLNELHSQVEKNTLQMIGIEEKLAQRKTEYSKRVSFSSIIIEKPKTYDVTFQSDTSKRVLACLISFDAILVTLYQLKKTGGISREEHKQLRSKTNSLMNKTIELARNEYSRMKKEGIIKNTPQKATEQAKSDE